MPSSSSSFLSSSSRQVYLRFPLTPSLRLLFLSLFLSLCFVLFVRLLVSSSFDHSSFGSDFPSISERKDLPTWTATARECHKMFITKSYQDDDDRQFVRSASSVRWVSPTLLAVISDDSNFLSVVKVSVDEGKFDEIDEHEGGPIITEDIQPHMAALKIVGISSFPLPHGHGALKFDFESMAVVSEEISPNGKPFLLIFGSGSNEKRRDIILYIPLDSLTNAGRLPRQSSPDSDGFRYVPNDWRDELYSDVDHRGRKIDKTDKLKAAKEQFKRDQQDELLNDEGEEGRRIGRIRSSPPFPSDHSEETERAERELREKFKLSNPSWNSRRRMLDFSAFSSLTTNRPKGILFYAEEFFSALRRNKGFSGSMLNIEGVDVMATPFNPTGNEGPTGDSVKMVNVFRFFQRGNGEDNPSAGKVAISASADVLCDDFFMYLNSLCLEDSQETLFPSIPSRPYLKRSPPSIPISPPLYHLTHYALGFIKGVPLTFMDIHIWGGGGAESEADGMVYLAGAEASPNALEDGANLGVVMGFLPRPSEILRSADSMGNLPKAKGGKGTGDSKVVDSPIRPHSFSSRNWKVIVTPTGEPFSGRAQGIVTIPFDHKNKGRPQSTMQKRISHLFTPDFPLHLLVVIDHDDHEKPSEMCIVTVNSAHQ